MSKSNSYEIDLLNLLLCAKAVTQIADNAASSAITAIWASLHTADPGDGGTQGTSEVAYTGYTRIAVTRSTAGFAVSTSEGTASPVAAIQFPQATSTSTGTITHAAFGFSSGSTSGKIFYSGALTSPLNFGSGTIPRLTTGSSVTED
jgi:hypothetical protein